MAQRMVSGLWLAGSVIFVQRVQRFPRAMWKWFDGLDILLQDALLYAVSGALALGNLLMAAGGDYRQWADYAVGPYLTAGLLLWFLATRKKISPSLRSIVRKFVIGALLLGCTVAPLTVSVIQRADATPGTHAQAEVAVIERCGDRVLNNRDCYLSHPTSPGNPVQSDSRSLDASAVVPYLPGVIPFGLPNDLPLPLALRDARVSMALFSLGTVLLALWLAPVDSSSKWRLFQVAIVLPTGALPMVTGGDDIPVIAVLLLAFVLAARRQPVWAGLACGVAATMKLTAWPLALILLFAIRDRDGARAGKRYGFAALSIALPVVGGAWIVGPRAFLVNEILFPLGLSGIKSPAQSPLLGQALVEAFPEQHLLVVGCLLGLGAILSVVVWNFCRPTTLSRAAALAACLFLLATILAPATRFGYLLYPANFLAWAAAARVSQPRSTSPLPVLSTTKATR